MDLSSRASEIQHAGSRCEFAMRQKKFGHLPVTPHCTDIWDKHCDGGVHLASAGWRASLRAGADTSSAGVKKSWLGSPCLTTKRGDSKYSTAWTTTRGPVQDLSENQRTTPVQI